MSALKAILPRLDAIKALAEKATPGPWQVWDGPAYVGGGRDLCIGAGETWLANMYHRNCEQRPCHVGVCKIEPDTDIASLEAHRGCPTRCENENHITDEQAANAALMAEAPAMRDALEEARELLAESERALSNLLAELETFDGLCVPSNLIDRIREALGQ